MKHLHSRLFLFVQILIKLSMEFFQKFSECPQLLIEFLHRKWNIFRQGMADHRLCRTGVIIWGINGIFQFDFFFGWWWKCCFLWGVIRCIWWLINVARPFEKMVYKNDNNITFQKRYYNCVILHGRTLINDRDHSQTSARSSKTTTMESSQGKSRWMVFFVKPKHGFSQ